MHTFIIAEAGVNHNGDMVLAKKMVEAAANAGADAIKFQTFQAKKLVSVHAPKAQYQKQHTDGTETQLQMIQKLELTKTDHEALIAHCKQHHILFLSSAFDEDSLVLLEELNLPLHKIPSGELNNLPFLRSIAATNKPVILSTGMSEMEEIQLAVSTLQRNGTTDLTLLHCNTQYPTPYHDVHLQAMDLLKETFGCKIGYSDHTLGIEVSLAAVARGACVIEKHITLDRTLPGPDHQASIEIDELHQMVRMIRNIEQAIGQKKKGITDSERKNREIARKSLVAQTSIKAGDVFTIDNLTSKRPGSGLDAKYFDDLMGKTASYDYEPDALIALNELEKR